MTTSPNNFRPPVVAIMGHIDHGKSTLLDYIRKTKIADSEAGGITQHLSAYEISIPYQNTNRAITFLDTPGHAAFTGMRERGALAADIAVLVVSAEDGVKAQTIEALKTIRDAKLPFVVAINKIDKPGANIEKTKLNLAENEVLVEGFGGDIPFVAISALNGAGIEELLETIILLSDLEELTFDPKKNAEGIVIESNRDPKRGVAATVIIKEGTLSKGQFVATSNAWTTTRIMENFLGKSVEKASAGEPVRLVGFDNLPTVGNEIKVFDKKKDAENYIKNISIDNSEENIEISEDSKIVPIIIKADVAGTAEAIEKEINKIKIENVYLKIIGRSIGTIGEADIKLAQSDKNTIILGFNTSLDSNARDMNEKVGASVEIFNVIYKLTEWLEVELEKRRPRITERVVKGKARVLKLFSATKDRQIIGCILLEGNLTNGMEISIIRRDFTIGNGTIAEIQQAKQKVTNVSEGEFGMQIVTKKEIAIGDILEGFEMEVK